MVMSSSNPQKVEYNDKELELPLSFEGKILAKYVGGQGKGKHTYRGPVSGAVHKRILFGNLVYVDPRDIRDPVNNTGPLKSLFIKVRKISSPDAPESSPTAKESEVPTDADEERTARVAPEREPVVDDVDEPEEEDDYEDEEYEYEPLPDIQNMSVNDIKQLDILPEEAEDLLEVEKQGKNRKSALRHLRKVAQS